MPQLPAGKWYASLTLPPSFLSASLGCLLCMQEFCVAVLPSAKTSLQTKRGTAAKTKGKKKSARARASKARQRRGSMAEDEEEGWDKDEFRGKVQRAFHLPIAKAAPTLGLCVTVLKQRCRIVGIPRWPFRKVHSIEKLVASVEQVPSQLPHMLAPPSMCCLQSVSTTYLIFSMHSTIWA
jgi:hypothetical protein